MKRIQKFKKFLEFVVEYKLPKLVKHMTLQELSDLCCDCLGCINLKEQGTLLVTGRAMMIMHTVERELCRRYPTNWEVQSTDFSKPEEVAKILEKLGGLNR